MASSVWMFLEKNSLFKLHLGFFLASIFQIKYLSISILFAKTESIKAFHAADRISLHVLFSLMHAFLLLINHTFL